MIVLHRGIDSNNIMHIGYATVIDGVARIITAQGKSIEVKLDSVHPIVDNSVYSKDIESLANGDAYKVHTIQSIENEIGACVVREMQHRGVHCVEDLQYWTLEDFMKLRGVGKKRAEKIIDILEKFIFEINDKCVSIEDEA